MPNDRSGQAGDRFWLPFVASPVPLAQFGSDGEVIEANPAFQELIRAPALPERGSLRIQELLERPADWDQLRERLLREGIVSGFHTPARRTDGTTFWAQLDLRAISFPDGDEVHFVGSFQDVSRRKREEEQLRHDALHDPLTGLANRALFRDQLDRALARLRREPERPFAVYFIDLDDFKDVNDSLGHLVGDELLVAFASRLQRTLRPEDTVARLGGDEFALLLDRVADEGEARGVYQRILVILDSPFRIHGNDITVSASVGAALCDDGTVSPEEILRVADRAMYVGKSRKGDRRLVVWKVETTGAVRLDGEGGTG